MKKNLILTFAALIVAVTVTTEAHAWANVGHTSIAYIAEQHLTPKAREKCHHYLKHSLAYYASWQDHWRFTDPYKEIHYWHTSKVDADNNPLYNEGRAADVQIERIRKEMKKYRKMDDSTIIVNLKLLIHMIGDMHCPSHTGYPDQPKYKSYKFKNKGKSIKFHGFWDGSPSYFHRGWTCEKFHENIDKLSKKEIAKITKGTATDWARVNGIEMREVYELIPRNAELTELPTETHDRMREIVDKQILRGAYRLAHVLNQIFKK